MCSRCEDDEEGMINHGDGMRRDGVVKLLYTVMGATSDIHAVAPVARQLGGLPVG